MHSVERSRPAFHRTLSQRPRPTRDGAAPTESHNGTTDGYQCAMTIRGLPVNGDLGGLGERSQCSERDRLNRRTRCNQLRLWRCHTSTTLQERC